MCVIIIIIKVNHIQYYVEENVKVKATVFVYYDIIFNYVWLHSNKKISNKTKKKICNNINIIQLQYMAL